MESKVCSVNSSNKTQTKSSVLSHNAFSQNIAPIFDQLSQIYVDSKLLEIIQFSFCILQIVFTSCWIPGGSFWFLSDISNYFNYLSIFSAYDLKIGELLILFYVLLFLICVTLILYSAALIYFFRTRRMITPVLYMIKLYHMTFGFTLLHPIAGLFGKLVIFIIETNSKQYISVAVFTFIIFVVAEIENFMYMFFVHNSLYIHRSLFMTFNVRSMCMLFIVNPLFLLFSFIFHFYPIWGTLILVLFHMAFVLYIIFTQVTVSFLVFSVNSFFSATLFTSLICDGFWIISDFVPKFKHAIFISVVGAVFVICVIVSFVVNNIYANRIRKNLAYSGDQNEIDMDSEQRNSSVKENRPSTEEKFFYFNQLKLNRSERKAMSYLIIGLSSMSDMFIDFSLVFYCADVYQNSQNMLLLLTRILVFFKGKKSIYNSIIRLLCNQKKCRYIDQYIYMQAFKIKVFRQATSTKESLDRLDLLRIMTQEVEELMTNFWEKSTSSVKDLQYIEGKRRKLENLWNESIEENWRSIIFREEHLRFLIESNTDFQKAIYMKNTIDLIENMKEDRADLCFLSFLVCYPQYLTKGFFDLEGNIIFKKENYAVSNIQGFSFDPKASSGTLTSLMDAAAEEAIAKSLFSFGKLRSAVQNSLKKSHPKTRNVLVAYAITSFVCSFIMYTVLLIYLINSFNSYNYWNVEVGDIINLQASYAKAFLSLTMKYGIQTKNLEIISIACDKNDYVDQKFLINTTNFGHLATEYVQKAIDHYRSLMSTIITQATKGINVYSLTRSLLQPIVNSSICYQNKVLSPVLWTTNDIITFDIMTFSVLSGSKSVEDWYSNNSYWCHDLRTENFLMSAFIDIRQSLTYELSNSSKTLGIKLKHISYAVYSITAVLFIIPVPIIIIFNSREINNLIRMMLLTEDEYKEAATETIQRKTANKRGKVVFPSSKNSINWHLIIYIFLIILMFSLSLLLAGNMLARARDANELNRNFGFWNGLLSLLKPNLMELLNSMINSIFLSYVPTTYTTSRAKRNRVYRILSYFESTVVELLHDTPDVVSIMGFDPRIDHLIAGKSCESVEKAENLHDVYECASMNRLFAAVHSMVMAITELVPITMEKYDRINLANIFHIIFVHIKPTIEKAEELLKQLQIEKVFRFKIDLIIVYLLSLVFLFFWAILVTNTILYLNSIFNMAIRLTRRLPPNGLISNHKLLDYLLNRKGHKIEMGVSQSIFNNTFDGIICINNEGIIQSVNNSFNYDYGYSPEQLLGQNYSILFDRDSKEKLNKQLIFLKNKECSSYEDHVICYTNDSVVVPSYVLLFGLKGNDNYFVLVIRDETELIKFQEMAENAKKQSQDLLDQIIPPKISIILKEGSNDDISFVVQSATVMFVNIVAFSAYSQYLSPQQIMGTLSTIFGAFDTTIQQFPLMTKIKLIGDSYMCASGLFTAEDKVEPHAQQCADFALSVLSLMEDINFKHNLNLQVRVGINSGGPLISGVLGTYNRVFDIIGDIINVASRLEHASEPSKIQISETTYNLIKPSGYIVVPRGEIFLKGKGNMKAYFLLSDVSSYL